MEIRVEKMGPKTTPAAEVLQAHQMEELCL
jgi:hypothetical protein